ncbi:hypothetical protein [Chitinolyticbacter albus]|uniref:hypothetical protein n=1 Tax=Chitinolyticbacter albus TaxID=2961951 RepID=UPI00210D167C|nr:hypothetical protein [Chitinolyticbacter albus]
MATLLVCRLQVVSSYVENTEYEAEGNDVDTVQWWLASDEAWRVRTFGVDFDIHVHHQAAPLTVEAARVFTEKHYGDVIADVQAFEFASVDDTSAVNRLVEALGGQFDVAPNGRLGIWNPGDTPYRSQSEPA